MPFWKRKAKEEQDAVLADFSSQPDGDGVARVFPTELFEDPQIGGLLREAGFSPNDAANIVSAGFAGPLNYGTEVEPVVPLRFAEVPAYAALFELAGFDPNSPPNQKMHFLDARTAAALAHSGQEMRSATSAAGLSCRPLSGPWRAGLESFLESQFEELRVGAESGVMAADQVRGKVRQVIAFAIDLTSDYDDAADRPDAPDEAFDPMKAVETAAAQAA